MAKNGTSTGDQSKLRFITYLAPSLPLTLYQTYQRYLEEALGRRSYLIVESRYSGPSTEFDDPFTSDEVDIGFMCGTPYLRLISEKKEHVELLPVAPIHIHPKSEMKPVFFSEVIINKSRQDKYKEFQDLKGHVWAYNDEQSLSGNVITLSTLKGMGANASFFGNIVHAGSHINSIRMVANGTVDGAAIDCNALNLYLKEHPELRERVHKLCTWGPMPIQPIVVNSRMPAGTKQEIVTALLNMNKSPKWQKELSAFDVWGFKEIDDSIFQGEIELISSVKAMTLHPTYY